MKNRKHIDVDDRSFELIEKGERDKLKMENDGWALVQTIRLGLDRWRLIYERHEKVS